MGLLALFLVAPLLVWAVKGEAFLAATKRLPAEALVVEGWIGLEGIRAAKAEFDQGSYKYIVTAGGPTNDRWSVQRWNYAIIAHRELIRLGVPMDQVIEAPAEPTSSQRTFATAVMVREALAARGLSPSSVNVFTMGTHARRSRLVFSKVLRTDVGVIGWRPAMDLQGPWWKSSIRADELIKESIGYVFEAVLNSGRTSNTSSAQAGFRSESRPGE